MALTNITEQLEDAKELANIIGAGKERRRVTELCKDTSSSPKVDKAAVGECPIEQLGRAVPARRDDWGKCRFLRGREDARPFLTSALNGTQSR